MTRTGKINADILPRIWLRVGSPLGEQAKDCFVDGVYKWHWDDREIRGWGQVMGQLHVCMHRFRSRPGGLDPALGLLYREVVA